jgi:hypothetical protein
LQDPNPKRVRSKSSPILRPLRPSTYTIERLVKEFQLSLTDLASSPEKPTVKESARGISRRSSPSVASLQSRDSKGSSELRKRSGGGMAGMLDTDRSRTRRERTFVGSECAVCEEPLEHTLRGERILQFSCGHVSHEACFYEYIKEFESQYCPTCNAPLGLDTSRGGNVLDIGKTFNSGSSSHAR